MLPKGALQHCCGTHGSITSMVYKQPHANTGLLWCSGTGQHLHFATWKGPDLAQLLLSFPAALDL